MKPTGRGWKLIAITILLSSSSILFMDPILMAASIISASILAASIVNCIRRVRRAGKVRVEPRKLDVKIRAGERGELLVKMYSETPFTIEEDHEWLRCDSRIVEPPSSLLRFKVGSDRSGKYELTSLRIGVYDFFELFKTDVRLPLTLKAVIYPRIVPWIIEALRLIGEGAAGFGEAKGKRKGHGFEYLWSREYQPQDPFKFVDWKATARLQKLMVKDFLEEAYGSIKIIYDIRAHGPVSRDECAAYFLSILVSIIQAGLSPSIVLKSGDELILDLEDVNPVDMLKLALAYVVEPHIVEEWDVYELFEPKSARSILDILREIKSSALEEVVKLKLDEALRRLRSFLKKPKTHIIYVGCILIESTFVKELAAMIADSGGKLSILTPMKPWLDSKDLEEAYLAYHSHRKLLRGLERMGAEIKFGEKVLA